MRNGARQGTEVCSKQAVRGVHRQRDLVSNLHFDQLASGQCKGRPQPRSVQEDPVGVHAQVAQVQVIIDMDGGDLERPIACIDDLNVEFQSTPAHHIIDLAVDEEDAARIEVAIQALRVLHAGEVYILPGIGVGDGIGVLASRFERDRESRSSVFLKGDGGDRLPIGEGKFAVQLKC